MAAPGTKAKHGGGRPPMLLPAYPVDASKPVYYAATDLQRYQLELRNGAKASKDLTSDDSIDYYCNQLRRITQLLGKDVQWLLGNATTSVRDLLALKRRDGKPMIHEWATLRGLVMAVLAVLKHVPGERARWPEAYAVWSDVLTNSINPLAKVKQTSNQLSERQQPGIIEWKAVLAKRDELLRTDPTSADALLLAIYTMRLGVARADFGDLRIYRPPTDPVDAEGSPERRAHPNFIVWTDSEGPGDGKMTLSLFEFKTAKHLRKKDEPHRPEVLSPALTAVIAASLRKKPRQWLFVQPLVAGHPPYDAKAFSRWVCRTLKRLFNRPLTLQILRHVAVTALDFSKLTEKERADIARDGFFHSPSMQMAYRLVQIQKTDGDTAGDPDVEKAPDVPAPPVPVLAPVAPVVPKTAATSTTSVAPKAAKSLDPVKLRAKLSKMYRKHS